MVGKMTSDAKLQSEMVTSLFPGGETLQINNLSVQIFN